MPQHSVAELSRPEDPGDPPPLGRYSRTGRTEADIRALARLPAPDLVAAFGAGEDGPDHRTTEALVHFILRAIQRDERTTVERLFRVLRHRCRPRFRSWTRGVANEADRIEIQDAVLARMTARLVRGGPACDFLQARFWRYLKLRTISAIHEVCDQRKEPLADDLGGSANDGGLPEAPSPREPTADERLMIKEALLRLPPDLRELYLLRHFAGWRVGDERKEEGDPDDPTLMEHFGIGRRALNKRLARAERLLADHRRDDL